MNLHRAFKERKRLSDYVNHLRNSLRTARLSHATSEGVSYHDKEYLIDGKSVDAAYKEYETVIETLIKVNSAIDLANATYIDLPEGPTSGRQLLNTLAAYKNAAEVSNKLSEKVKEFNPVVKDYDSRAFNHQTQQLGAYVSTDWKLDTNIDFEAKNKDMKIAIRKCELLLDEFNAKAVVELSPEVEEFLNSAYDC